MLLRRLSFFFPLHSGITYLIASALWKFSCFVSWTPLFPAVCHVPTRSLWHQSPLLLGTLYRTSMTAEPPSQIPMLEFQTKKFSTCLCTKPRIQPILKQRNQTLSLECCTFNNLFLNALTHSYLTQSLTPRKYPFHLFFSKKVPGRSAGQSRMVKIQTTQAK